MNCSKSEITEALKTKLKVYPGALCDYGKFPANKYEEWAKLYEKYVEDYDLPWAKKAHHIGFIDCRSGWCDNLVKINGHLMCISDVREETYEWRLPVKYYAYPQ